MSAASDYQQAVRMLAKPLPAYVTYVQHGHAKIDAIDKTQTSEVTVRTRDGKIVKGKGLEIVVGEDKHTTGSILKNSPFDPACYEGVSSHPSNFDGQDASAIALKDVCKHDAKDDDDFSVIYVDAKTLVPLAVVGGKNDPPVDVHIEERFASTGGYVLPGTVAVRVKGSGMMLWLDVDAHMDFTNYRFSDKSP
jgi:hypothetical protein